MIEIQAKYRLRDSDTRVHVENALARRGFHFEEIVTQDDTYYRGDCLDSEDLLRLRHEHGGADDFADTLTWKGFSTNQRGVQERLEINVGLEPEIHAILTCLHLDIDVRLAKAQTRYRSPELLASIDEVGSLGSFLELQVLPSGPQPALVGRGCWRRAAPWGSLPMTSFRNLTSNSRGKIPRGALA